MKIAIIGVGHWGPNIVRNLMADPRLEVVVCDTDVERVAILTKNYRHLSVTSCVDDIFSDKQIDAAIVCTPTVTHYALTKRLLECGKHVFVEKPMATRASECEDLIRIADKMNRKLMVGHVFMFNTGVRYVKGLIDKGELGDILYLCSTRVNLGPVRKDVNALWDLAPHDISIFNLWLGGLPTAVSARGLRYLNPSLHDIVFASLWYPCQILVNLHVSWLDPRKVRQIVVVGSKKMVVFDDLDPMGAVHIYDKTAKSVSDPALLQESIQAYKVLIQDGDLVIPKLKTEEPLKVECQAFLDWLFEDKKPICRAEQGLAVVQVLEALDQSLTCSGINIELTSSQQTKLAA
ncbi:MAG: Gfo/Idh/MocA family oxidoreductase [Deltaproteobacteria bacterium]|nr:Gfo/Idh/MocA family oxidoreductase [Deltaproteobacteria bacterium]